MPYPFTGITEVELYHNPNEGRTIWNQNFQNLNLAIESISVSGNSSNLWSASTGLNSIIANNGSGNLASGENSFVGGSGNVASGENSSVIGGSGNTISGVNSFIGGGHQNITSGINSAVIGGSGNTTSGANSIILGCSDIVNSADNTIVVPNIRVVIGGKIAISNSGPSPSIGIATLVSGSTTVSTTAIGINSIVMLTIQSAGGTVGSVYVSSKILNTSFTITSTSALDSSSVGWVIIDTF